MTTPVVEITFCDPNLISRENRRRMKRRYKALAKFLEVEKLEYIDHGNWEELRITRNGVSQSINARGNKYDGGFFTLGEERD